MKQLAKRALSTKALLKWSKGNRFIFCYHDVSDPTAGHHSSRYSTTPERFKEQLGLYADLFTVLPLDQIVEDPALPLGKNYAALTFDDGFHSVLTHAWPMMKAMGFPCTVFLNGAAVMGNRSWITDLVLAAGDQRFVHAMLSATRLGSDDASDPIGAIMARGQFTEAFEDRPMLPPQPRMYLDQDDVRYLYGEGVSFGDHGWDHCVLSRCQAQVLNEQLVRGKGLLTDLTGSVSRHFALPFGKKEHYDPAVLATLQHHGYRYVYTTNPNRLRTDQVGKEGVLPRISVMNETVQETLFYINRSLLRTYDI